MNDEPPLPLALWGVFPNLPPVARFEPVVEVPSARRERARGALGRGGARW